MLACLCVAFLFYVLRSPAHDSRSTSVAAVPTPKLRVAPTATRPTTDLYADTQTASDRNIQQAA